MCTVAAAYKTHQQFVPGKYKENQGFGGLYNQVLRQGVNKLDDKGIHIFYIKKLQISQMSLKTEKIQSSLRDLKEEI